MLAVALLPQQQMFRIAVDAVRVDVLVMDGNRPVGGLTADDFELRDSGVRQTIDSIAFEDAPLSVMLALDASRSVAGEPLGHLKDAATAAAGLLLPRDRVALLTFSTQIDLRADWSSDRDALTRAIAATTAGGATSLHDAAFTALTLRDPAAGRALVLLFSDGEDTISWLAGQTVLDAARRSDAVVYGVGVRGAHAGSAPGFRVDFRSGLQPDIPNVPPRLLMQSFLAAVAEETGGKHVEAESTIHLRNTFEQVIREFRTRYLLTYVPRGVDAGGWHPIEVKLKGGRRGKITARRGYLR
jgi:Ca-activated chloride channel family protein